MKKIDRGWKMDTEERSLQDRLESIGQLLDTIDALLDEIEKKGKEE